MLLEFTCNGVPVRLEADPAMRALDLLRDRLGLTGTKEGCGRGECGACTILVDGRPVNACLLYAAKLQGREVLTVEGLAPGAELHPLQKAFLEAGAVQCGYCTPGLLLSAKALLDRHPHPSLPQIEEALSGNFCRCTGYAKIVRAVERAADLLESTKASAPAATQVHPERPAGLSDKLSVVGHPVSKVDGPELMTGQARFTADYRFPGMLYGYARRAGLPAGRIRSIDTAEALRVPGVVAVLTARDIPGPNLIGILPPCDQPLLAVDEVRYEGESLALAVASTREAARRGAAAVRVQIDPLPPILTLEQALAVGARKIHPGGNITYQKKLVKGDVRRGFEQADVVVENTYHTSFQEHAYLEPEAVLAIPGGDGRITVYASCQSIFHLRGHIAANLGLPASRVRVIQAYTGGSFGGKDDVATEIGTLAALAAVRCGAPVLIAHERAESIIGSNLRHAARIHYKTGARRDGTLVARQVEVLLDGGAYASESPFVTMKALIHTAGPYLVPNVLVEATAVYTNKTYCGAFRGFGVPQVTFASESQLDELALALRMDPLELRRRNALKPGQPTATGQVFAQSVGLLQTIELIDELRREAGPPGGKGGAGASEWQAAEPSGGKGGAGASRGRAAGPPAAGTRPAGAGRQPEAAGAAGVTAARAYPALRSGQGERYRTGRGVACLLQGISNGAEGVDVVGASVQVSQDGSAVVGVGLTDFGQGARTVYAQVASEVLGIPLERITVRQADTDGVHDSGPTVASRSTTVGGMAVLKAAGEVAGSLRTMAAAMLKCPQDRVLLQEGFAVLAGQGEARIPLGEVATAAYWSGLPLMHLAFSRAPDARFDHETHQGDIYIAYNFGTHLMDVRVDTWMGRVEVLRHLAAHDVGRVINPLGLEGQVEGGALIGFGLAHLERVESEGGHIQNANFADYALPTVLDRLPTETLVVEDPNPTGPFGAKGVGEPPVAGTAAAFANAVANALGIRFTRLPITREDIVAALQAGAAGSADAAGAASASKETEHG